MSDDIQTQYERVQRERAKRPAPDQLVWDEIEAVPALGANQSTE